MTASPPPQPKGWLSELISSVFAYIDRPWKAVVVVILILVCGLGYAAYEQRELIFEAWLTPSTPELKTDEIPEALEKLTTETDADLIQIWSVDLASNSQWFIAARRHDGERPFVPSPRRLPIIDRRSDVVKLEAVLEGRPSCVDLSENGTPLARRLFERGMKRGCAVPIPPNREAFLGVIYLAWSWQVDQSNEQVAVGVARDIARKLATY